MNALQVCKVEVALDPTRVLLKFHDAGKGHTPLVDGEFGRISKAGPVL